MVAVVKVFVLVIHIMVPNLIGRVAPFNFMNLLSFEKLKISNQVFVLIGVRHTNKTSDKLFDIIKSELYSLSSKHPNGIVISEMDCSFINSNNIDDFIEVAGEAGALYFLSKKNNLPIIVPEPSYFLVLNKLLEKFNQDKVIYTMTRIRLESELRKGASLEKLTEAIKKYFNYINKNTDQVSNLKFSPDIDWFIQKQFNGNKEEYNQRGKWVKSSELFSDEIMKEMIKIRDNAICHGIEKLIKEGNSLFIVYGNKHIPSFSNFIKENIFNY